MDTTTRKRLKCSGVKLPLTFYEFFAGGGMARLGLGATWQCTFATEWCEKKAAAYRSFFGGAELKVDDVANLTVEDLPGVPNLVWGSFPCQDLSLAGAGSGLAGERSGTFKPFWKLVSGMISAGRIPRIVVLENVIGALTSHNGKDFATIIGALVQDGYRVGAVVMDAVRFLPHSRPRLFVVGVHQNIAVGSELFSSEALEPWHTKSLRWAFQRLPEHLQNAWVWWNLPIPAEPIPAFGKLIENQPTGVEWHTAQETEHIIGLMSAVHLEKLRKAQALKSRIVGTVYRRIRPNEDGVKVQRAEIRFDQISGCLRTPAGGSSRQTLVIVEGQKIRSRLLSPREAARLMGVPDSYVLPKKYNEAYHLFGDGLAVPVVAWLSKHLLTPIAARDHVGQTNEMLQVRIGRHLTNQRTDAVAMNVLDPFEVAEIEPWPLWDLQDRDKKDAEAKAKLNGAEHSVFQRVLEQSSFGAVLNEGDIAPTAPIELPASTRGGIIPPGLYEQRKHPDVRIARRATTIAALARVISERKVSKGLRRTLLTQARRLERLATRRYNEIGGGVPIAKPGDEV